MRASVRIVQQVIQWKMSVESIGKCLLITEIGKFLL